MYLLPEKNITTKKVSNNKDFRRKSTKAKSSRSKRKSGQAVKIGLKLPNVNLNFGVGRESGER